MIQNKRQYNKRLHKNNCVVSSFSVLTGHVRKDIPHVLAIYKAYDLIQQIASFLHRKELMTCMNLHIAPIF